MEEIKAGDVVCPNKYPIRLMDVESIENGKAKCIWHNRDQEHCEQVYALGDLQKIVIEKD